MTKCLICGKENAGWLCLECAPSCDKEKLCNDFCVYRIGCGRLISPFYGTVIVVK